MTVAIVWILRIIFFYFLIRFVFALFKSPAKSGPKADGKKSSAASRFDDKGKNISDADFKDIR
jgi:hypothetical protein